MKRILLLALMLVACGTERPTTTEIVMPKESNKRTTCWEEVECSKVFLRGRLTTVCQTKHVCEEENSTENIKYLMR